STWQFWQEPQPWPLSDQRARPVLKNFLPAIRLTLVASVGRSLACSTAGLLPPATFWLGRSTADTFRGVSLSVKRNFRSVECAAKRPIGPTPFSAVLSGSNEVGARLMNSVPLSPPTLTTAPVSS